VVEDQRLDPGARRGPRRVLHGRVVVEHVEQPGKTDRLDQVAPHHGVHEHVGPCAQPVQARTGHGVAGEHHRLVTVVDPVADGGVHGLVVGRRRGHADVAQREHHAVGHLVHHRVGAPVEVLVVREAVADVLLEHGLGGPHHALGPDRAVDGERVRDEGGDPAGGDDVVEVGDVVAVQVGEQQRLQGPGGAGRRRRPQQHAPAAVHQQVAGRGAHQRRGPGPVRVGQRAAAAEDGRLHGGPPSSMPPP
jgi:hypothetical protein